jgi:Ca2+-binding RTX toxin-like protein
VRGIEAINLAGGGNTLNLSASRVAALSDTDELRVFGSGSDRLVFDDAASWTRGTPSAGFVTFTSGSATVIAAESLVSVVSGPTPGNDTLSGTAGNDTMDLLAGNDSYLGLDGADSILGNDGDDTLDGGNGNDTLSGGAGSDLYFVNDTSDQIFELIGGGADTVISSVSISMPDQVEALQIAAGVTGITLTGGAGNDMLIGNGLANNMNGGAGDDVILAGNVTLADIYALFAS